jgi:hypothetical protein
MNFHWLWLEWFQSLPITGKVAIIAGHILVLLLIMLDAIATSQKGDANKSPTAMTCSSEPAVKLIQAIRNSPKKGNLYNTNKRVGQLLNLFCNKSLIKHLFYYQTCDEGDKPTHKVQSHIRNIVAKLRKLVNQNGKEPANWLRYPCLVYQL